MFCFFHLRTQEQNCWVTWRPTPVFLPGESQGREPGGLPSTGSHRVGHDWRDFSSSGMVVLFLLFSVFHSGCVNLYSHQWYTRFPFSSHPCQNLFVCVFFWWLSFWQVWGDISLWFWFVFSWWLAKLSIFACACWPSVFLLWKSVYSVSAHFSIGLFVGFFFLILSCMNCLYMLDISPYLVISFANIFSHLVGCLFILLMVSFAV